MSNLDRFVAEYRVQLPIAVAKYPDQYMLSVPVAVVADRMDAAIRRGSYNHDGHAFRLTCKALGFKHTRTAIESFIRGGGEPR